MKQTRKHLTGEEKVAVLRRHLLDKLAVWDICDEVGIQPSQFYPWLKQFFENGAQALARNGGKDAVGRSHDTGRVEKLEAKLRQKNEVIAELLEEHVALKESWGGLTGQWFSQEKRDQVVDFIRRWTRRSELPARRLVSWLGVGRSKFHRWCERFGQANAHKGWQPRDFWLKPWKRARIIEY